MLILSTDEKNALYTFTVPFLRWGFAPHSSVSAVADRVPYVNILLLPIMILLYSAFVNTLSTKALLWVYINIFLAKRFRLCYIKV